VTEPPTSRGAERSALRIGPHAPLDLPRSDTTFDHAIRFHRTTGRAILLARPPAPAWQWQFRSVEPAARVAKAVTIGDAFARAWKPILARPCAPSVATMPVAARALYHAAPAGRLLASTSIGGRATSQMPAAIRTINRWRVGHFCVRTTLPTRRVSASPFVSYCICICIKTGTERALRFPSWNQHPEPTGSASNAAPPLSFTSP